MKNVFALRRTCREGGWWTREKSGYEMPTHQETRRQPKVRKTVVQDGKRKDKIWEADMSSFSAGGR